MHDMELADTIQALFRACEVDDIQTVKAIVPDILDPTILGDFGQSPLIAAAAYGSNRVVKYLLSLGASPDGHSLRGETALMKSSARLSTSRLLVEAGADVNAVLCPSLPLTPLRACMNHPAHNVKVFRLLLEAGADPFLADESGRSPADLASGKFRVALDEFLEQR